MFWNRTSSVFILLMVFHALFSSVECDEIHEGTHAPEIKGNVLDGAFGGAPRDDQIKWRRVPTQDPPTGNADPTTISTTEEPTTEKTEEPTTEAKEEPTTEAATEATTEATTELTKEPTTEATEEPTTVEVSTTAEVSTEEPTTEATEERTTEVTEESTVQTTEEQTTKSDEPTTEEPTTAVTDEPTTDDSGKVMGNKASGRFFDEKLPNGQLIKSLGPVLQVYPGKKDWSQIVANENGLYVLHPVQTKEQKLIFDPFTIGQVLGYIYEREEFGNLRPPGGRYTIELMGYAIPSPRGKRSFGVYQGKVRRQTLVFTKKAMYI